MTLDQPRVRLVEGSNRVNAGLDVALNIPPATRPSHWADTWMFLLKQVVVENRERVVTLGL
ncbi:MAG: hypothetical protein FIA97_14805 [Methylococcaceae bacterium]|nr:hypothetical protein [Methylococcaceae bacterium]